MLKRRLRSDRKKEQPNRCSIDQSMKKMKPYHKTDTNNLLFTQIFTAHLILLKRVLQINQRESQTHFEIATGEQVVVGGLQSCVNRSKLKKNCLNHVNLVKYLKLRNLMCNCNKSIEVKIYKN